MPTPDKLDEIFRMQDLLNKKIGVDLASLSQDDKTKWALNYSRAMSQELAELIDSFPWKWWAKYQKIDEQNARVEVVDLFHFLVSLAQTLGMSAEDIYQGYLKKNEVNHARQASGYAVKDHADSKHIELPTLSGLGVSYCLLPQRPNLVPAIRPRRVTSHRG